MKNLNSKVGVLIVGIAASSFALAGTEKVFVESDNSFESNICVAAATMNKRKLTTKLDTAIPGNMKASKLQFVANELTCNGMPVAEFAFQAGNYEVANVLAEYERNNVKILDIAQLSSMNTNSNG